MFRELHRSAEQAVAEYGSNMVSEKTRELSSSKPDDQVCIVWAIYPRKDAKGNQAQNMPIASCHFERDSKTILRESGHHEMPVVVPRWACCRIWSMRSARCTMHCRTPRR